MRPRHFCYEYAHGHVTSPYAGRQLCQETDLIIRSDFHMHTRPSCKLSTKRGNAHSVT